MRTRGMRNFVNQLGRGLSKHSPELLTAIGVTNMCMAIVFSVKGTPKAMDILDEVKEQEKEKADLPDEEIILKPLDVVKATWKCYIPAAVCAGTGIACIIGAHSVNAKRKAALATAYQISKTALSEYRDKVIETVGEEAEKDIRKKVAQSNIEKSSSEQKEIIITTNGKVLCYDQLGGRYFESDAEHIHKVENLINKRILEDGYVSLNELYYELGLSGTKMGDYLGWNMDDTMLEITLSSCLADNDKPCLAIDFNTPPKYDFSKWG